MSTKDQMRALAGMTRATPITQPLPVPSHTPNDDGPFNPTIAHDISPHLADCGHISHYIRFENGRSSCAPCWASTHCRFTDCQAEVWWSDTKGSWWCKLHKRGAELMLLGKLFDYPHLRLGIHDAVPAGRIGWLVFAQHAPMVTLVRAIWAALETQLMTPPQAIVEEALAREQEGD